jgi:taurine dioxygenase
MNSVLQFKPMTGVIGAEVEGVDLTKPLSREHEQALRKALGEYLVLVFRDQSITPQQQYDFATAFGPVAKGLVDPGNEPAPGITKIESNNAKNLTDEWHSDHTFVEVPPMAAMLHGVVMPKSGGDTLWVNTAAAYDELSAPMRDFLDGLTATHDTVRMMRRIRDAGKTFNYLMDEAPVTHPVVRVHPETGRKALFVCPSYTSRIKELTEAESEALLKFLYEHMKGPQFQLRLKWTPATTVIWDERATVHCAVGDYDEPRVVHRLMIDGTRPFGVHDLPIAA